MYRQQSPADIGSQGRTLAVNYIRGKLFSRFPLSVILRGVVTPITAQDRVDIALPVHLLLFSFSSSDSLHSTSFSLQHSLLSILLTIPLVVLTTLLYTIHTL